MDFANIYAQGFARVAARVLPIKLADPAANAAAIIADAQSLATDAVCLAVYPELSLTGATCGDLFLQQTLLDATDKAIATLLEASKTLLPIIIVGAPLRWENRVYNCAVVIHGGRLGRVVPKSYLSAAEARWFASGDDISGWIDIPDTEGATFDCTPVIEVLDVPGMEIGIEIGDDMTVPVAPHARMALSGATVLVNLSASPADMQKAEARLLAAQSASVRCNAAFIYTCAGWGESSTDAAWDGHAFVYECGDLLGVSKRFSREPAGVVVDVDLRRLAAARQRQNSFDDNLTALSREQNSQWRYSRFALANIGPGISVAPPDGADGPAIPTGDLGLRRAVPRFPFVPDDPVALARRSEDVYHIQVSALARRLSAVGGSKAVIGISGGLDSTNALLVAAGAMDACRRPHTDILAFTLPGFATSKGTKSNAWALMKAVGVTAEEIDIRPAAKQMLSDLGHPEDQYDVTYENIQAGLRADYLFRAANQRGGLVVGTGDLSEAALGWCTYGVGDHMSHYNVNAGLPKTLMQHQIRWVIDQNIFPKANPTLKAILEQEISPELVPGAELQSTESTVGPYALNDFFLHYLLEGHTPSRIAYLAWQAWQDDGVYDLATIKSWLEKFYKRFFASQFKRSASVDGPQVLPISLSPRGGWVMPSDATPETWLADCRDIPTF